MFDEDKKVGNYEIIGELGEGAQGKVYKVRWKTTRKGEVVGALKFLNSSKFQEILTEVSTWAVVSRHDNILTFITAGEDNKRFFIISEIANNGDLDDWIKNKSGKEEFYDEAIEIMCGVLKGLEHLHESDVIHRDIKPANILLNDNTPLLADFGLARSLDFQQSRTLAGTEAFMSAEFFEYYYSGDHKLNYERTEMDDLWAVAGTFQAMFTGKRPFSNNDAIRNCQPNPLPTNIPTYIRDFFKKAFAKNINERFQTAKEMEEALVSGMRTIIDINIQYPNNPIPDPTQDWRKIEQSVWEKTQKADTLSDYKNYLERYPKGQFANICQEQIARIERQEANRIEVEAKRKREQEELSFWAEVQKANTPTKYQSYLQLYPNGKFVDICREKISEIEKDEEEEERLKKIVEDQNRREAEAKRKREEIQRIKDEVEKQNRKDELKPQTNHTAWVFGGLSAFLILILGIIVINSLQGDDRSNSNSANLELLNNSETKSEDTSTPTPTPTLPETLTNSIGMEFVKIPSGSFMMGSPSSEEDRGDDEGPQHRVTISKDFYMGKYEVTQEQYEKVMGTNPSNFKNCQRCPVENVSWDDAQDFIKKLNAKNEGTYRLPSEAEWEYAARAGTTTVFAFGNSLSSNQANFDGNYPYGKASKGKYLEKTTEVGSYQPNAWGLYDMHGNVWEWCEDWYGSYSSESVTDPTGATSGSYRVKRGGGWFYSGKYLRSADRGNKSPSILYNFLGFRIIRE